MVSINGNIQSSVALPVMNEVQEAANREGISVSRWVRETILARLERDRADNANRADDIAARMKAAQKRFG